MILTGGRSTRMGSPKEAVVLGGLSLLQRVVDTLSDCTDRLVVVRRDPHQRLPDLPTEVAIVDDDVPGQGPLCAMATGMRHLRTGAGLQDEDAVFVCGCDAARLDTAAVDWMFDQLTDHDLAMPLHDGVHQPLCAVYRLGCLPVVERLLDQGVRTPRSLVAEVRARILDTEELLAFDPDLAMLDNVNTPQDLDRVRRLLREEGR